MINLDYVNIQKYVREKVQDIAKIKVVTSIALGVAISQVLQIPTTELDNAEAYYSSSLRESASIVLSEFNESVVIDVNLVEETARSYWMYRYYSAHPNTSVSLAASGEFGFLAKLTNTARFFNPVTYKLCEQNSEVMITIVNRIVGILRNKAGLNSPGAIASSI
jgi:hypothetical protein